MNYSVLIPVHKGDDPEFFRQSVQSMLEQSVGSDDIVVVKDGPVTEGLEQILTQLQQDNPGRIHPLQLPVNVGLGMALNAGLEACRYELVARMDADDISLPQRCEQQLEMFAADPELDIVGCPVTEFSGDPSNVIGCRNVPATQQEILRFARRRDPFNHPTVMYRKSKVLTYGPYDNYRKNQDTALWIKLLDAGCKGANCTQPLFLFRFDDRTCKRRKSWVNTKLLLQIRWDGYRRGFNSLWDFLVVAAGQLCVFVVPVGLQQKLYQIFLRK